MPRALVAALLCLLAPTYAIAGSGEYADASAVAAPVADNAPAAAAPGSPAATSTGPTLAAVRKRGKLRCGASANAAGFGQVDAQGHWSGFDVDFCRAVATAVLGSPDKVDFVPLTAKTRFAALRDGTIDILDRVTTWTLSREASHDILFAGVTYYDGQGFLVRRTLGIKSALDLQSQDICVQQDTTTELNLADFFSQRGLPYKPKVFPTAAQAESAFRSGACGALTTDTSALFVVRAGLPDGDASLILPQVISKEPLGPAVRQGDDTWFLLVRWTLAIMIDAEEMGISQSDVDAMTRNDNPRVKRLLGIDGNFGQNLGLSADWAYRVIKFVGNYGDVFERNLGAGSRLKIKRAQNDLWTRGGLLYGAPIQ